ncbi:MAG: AAA family ATPase [Cyanobacteria bacterium P01_H01_bin.153]
MTVVDPSAFPEFSGYRILNILYSGEKTVVYRAIQVSSQQSVVIKLLSQDYPSFSELTHFRNQYILAKTLSIPGVARPIALEPWKNSYALIMSDFGGVSLKQYVARRESNSLSIIESFSIALQMADILHELAQQQIVHKDIKPTNVLIHPESKHIELIDFSIATRLNQETQDITSPNDLEGTLAYIAPEQTGRVNRGIDYRTDFYSLGVTLYELLTGQLPFTSTDPLELVHAHITRQPTPLTQQSPTIPPIVSQLVLKLMAKNVEDRYQTARGLKHDLSRCLSELEQTGTVEDFELSTQDSSDRFLIPQRLYGRQQSIKTLNQALARSLQGSTEFMLVVGYSGIGKTAVIKELHKPITQQRGYFIQGKFDQFNRSNPFSAFVQAFRNLMEQLLGESDQAIAHWKSNILIAVGDSGQVLIDVIPELEHIIGQQPSVAALSDSASQNRFNRVFSQFVRVFTQPEHPLTIFLDDLQWADSASLHLMKLLMDNRAAEQHGHLLMLGAYRDNEVSPGHLTMLALDDIQKQGQQITTLTLAPLQQPEITQLVADTLRCAPAAIEPLAELIYKKAKGNPFFTTQLLLRLHRERYITFETTTDSWQCDFTKLRQLTLTEDVVSFMVEQLRQLPEATQRALTLAACIGNRFDLETLSIVSERSAVRVLSQQMASDLWPALRANLVVPEGETYKFFQGDISEASALHMPIKQGAQVTVYYRFLHDRIQQAAYSLLPDKLRARTHTAIGRLLLNNTPTEKQSERIFEIVNQLNQGTANLETETLESNKAKEELIRLNVKAGQKAQEATAYAAASDYFEQGVRLLNEAIWEQQRSLCLQVHENAAAAASMTADFDTMERHIEAVLTRANSVLETIAVQETRIQTYVAQNQPLTAVKAVLNVLGDLGETISFNPSKTEIASAIEKAQQAWASKDVAQLVNLPLNRDPQKLAILKLLMYVHPAVFFSAPQLIPVEICVRTHICLTCGNSPESAHTYADYGLFLCGIIGDIETGYAFGQLALAITERFPESGLQARGKVVTYFTVSHWKESLSSLRSPIKLAYQEAVEVGDLEFAAYGAALYCAASFLAGAELQSLIEEMPKYTQAIERMHQVTSLGWSQIYYQTALNLANGVEQPWLLIGSAYDERDRVPALLEANEFSGIFLTFTNKLTLAYLFEEYDLAREYASVAKEHVASVTAMLMQPPLFLYDSLIQLETYATSETPAQLLETVAENQAKLKKWSHHCPENYLHKYHLVEARKLHALGHFPQAIEHYDKAISISHQNQFEQEEALAHELAAKCCLDWGKERIAASYMLDAYYGYSRWGASLKATQLTQRYTALLQPILQPALSPVETATLSGAHSISNQLSISSDRTAFRTKGRTVTASSVSVNDTLDLKAALQASQALSGIVEVNELLRQLIQTSLQQSGGDQCALLLCDNENKNSENNWTLAALGTPQHASILCEPMDSREDLPLKLLNYVKRTKKIIVIDNLNTQLPVIDSYLTQTAPKSILCSPLLNKGKLIGLLYLRNQSISGVFNSSRLITISFICTQAAISLESARLYQKLQDYATQVEQSQLDVVKYEKMATLGNLVAGVAHEINNPIGFLNGSLENAQDYLEDILFYLETLQQQYPEAVAALQDHAEDIDLDFVIEDFPKLLASMGTANQRIETISKSLRTFSRADADKKVSADLHENLDSTLLILKYRLKGNEARPSIQIIKSYGELPTIECFPGQLNQVFMNILANAIDVLDEAAAKSSFKALEANPQTIAITTENATENRAVIIRIRDNGKGMSDETQARIFENLFTTKAVGKGTGLGLAIVRKIVESEHGGKITVSSTLGKGTEFSIQLPY